jgi:hypothetical protein
VGCINLLAEGTQNQFSLLFLKTKNIDLNMHWQKNCMDIGGNFTQMCPRQEHRNLNASIQQQFTLGSQQFQIFHGIQNTYPRWILYIFMKWILNIKWSCCHQGNVKYRKVFIFVLEKHLNGLENGRDFGQDFGSVAWRQIKNLLYSCTWEVLLS